jgi:hypothetical protein
VYHDPARRRGLCARLQRNNGNRDNTDRLLLLLLLNVSLRKTGRSTSGRGNEGVGSRRVTHAVRGGVGGGSTSGREPSGRVNVVGVGSAVGGRVGSHLRSLGSAGLEERSNEGIVDFLGVVCSWVEKPDEECELEGKVLGEVVEDYSECCGFNEVEESD